MARRRLVTAAVAGLLAVTALAGCRAEPGSAAFVGSTRITTGTVNDMLDGIRADGGRVEAANEGAARQQIASTLVFVEVAMRFAAAQGYPAPTPDYQGVAGQLSLPTSDPYVRALAQAQAYTTLLEQQVTPAAVSDDEYGRIADQAISQSGGDPANRNTIIGQLKATGAEPIGRAVAVRDELTKAVKHYNVAVNPLYSPAAWTLLQGTTAAGQTVDLVVLPLTAGATTAPAVINVTQTE